MPFFQRVRILIFSAKSLENFLNINDVGKRHNTESSGDRTNEIEVGLCSSGYIRKGVMFIPRRGMT